MIIVGPGYNSSVGYLEKLEQERVIDTIATCAPANLLGPMCFKAKDLRQYELGAAPISLVKEYYEAVTEFDRWASESLMIEEMTLQRAGSWTKYTKLKRGEPISLVDTLIQRVSRGKR